MKAELACRINKCTQDRYIRKPRRESPSILILRSMELLLFIISIVTEGVLSLIHEIRDNLSLPFCSHPFSFVQVLGVTRALSASVALGLLLPIAHKVARERVE